MQVSGLGRRKEKTICKISEKRRLGVSGACKLIPSYGRKPISVDYSINLLNHKLSNML
jgi:hypothetical protein